MSGQCFEISANLVAYIAGIGGAVGAGNDDIDHAMLHQMSAYIIGDNGMIHAMLPQFPGG